MQNCRMGNVRFLLLALLGLIACIGAGIVLFAGIGDAGVIASTAGVHRALETAGQQDNLSLRNDLYAVVLRLQQPWSLINSLGAAVVIASVFSFTVVWQKVR